MSFVTIKNTRTAPKIPTARRRASSGKKAVGGSVYNKLVNGRVQTKLTVAAAFQKKHKIAGYNHVRLQLDEKTHVLALAFVKTEKPGVTFAVNRDGGTAFIAITAALLAFGFQLKESMYNEEYVFNKQGDLMLVDLSDNLVKAKLPKLKRDAKTGRLATISAAEKQKRLKDAEARTA